jgi:hypothetical protein
MRTRFLALPLLLAAAALAPTPSTASAQTDQRVSHADSAAPPSAAPLVLYADSIPTMHIEARASLPLPEAPKTKHLAPLMAFAVAGAVKRRPSRRAAGVKIPDVPMFLDSDVHVMRDKELTVIRGGVLVDDTDLEDDEIEELLRHKVIRPATSSELASLDQASSDSAKADLIASQEQEMAALTASHEAATAEAQAAGKSDAQLAKLAQKQSEEVSALREQHAAALAG